MNETQPFDHIRKRDGAVVPFTPIRITNAIYRAAVAVGGRDRSVAEKLTGQVIAYVRRGLPDGIPPTVEHFQDAIEKVLIESGHARTAKAFILYRDERARKRDHREGTAAAPRSGDSIPWKKIWEVLNWAIDHRVATVGQLNERVVDGTFRDLVAESEEAYSLDIARAADAILRRQDEVKIVIIAGPSSSGKTSTTIKTAEHLKNEGFEFVPFHVDNYFFNLEAHPKDEFGDYDYETPQAIDLELLNRHLRELLDGKTVEPPYFNFKTGKREGTTGALKLAKGQILLIDTLHGLYGPMTEGIPNAAKFRLYIETLLQMRNQTGAYIRWTDIRLIRRMVRDFQHRNMTPQKTLEHWHYVRSSELRHIVPYVNSCDYIVNGALPYELPIWAARMKETFSTWLDAYTHIPARRDAHERSHRVHALLESVTPWTDEGVVPGKALLREFIGGSEYDYH